MQQLSLEPISRLSLSRLLDDFVFYHRFFRIIRVCCVNMRALMGCMAVTKVKGGRVG